MLTTTEITGEETQDKKNPRFLILLLALFIIAGIGYSAYWWFTQTQTILPIVEEKTISDDSAKAWYEEQKRLMEASLRTVSLDSMPPDSVASAILIDSADTAPPVIPPTDGPSSDISSSNIPVNKSASNSLEVSNTNSAAKVIKRAEPTTISKPVIVKDFPKEDVSVTSKPVRQKMVIADNIKRVASRSNESVYQDANQRTPMYNGSIPPTNNRRPIEQAYRPIQQRPVAQEKYVNDISTMFITREELEEFMRQYPYRKMTIQFVGYIKPTEAMEGVKAQIIQFLRQNGYSDIDTQWHIWSDHTPVKEVHYGKYGATGANFYIPSVH